MRVAASDRSNGKKMRNIVRHSANLEFAFFTKARFCLRITRKEGWAFKTKICFCRERDTHKKHKFRQQNGKFILLKLYVKLGAISDPTNSFLVEVWWISKEFDMISFKTCLETSWNLCRFENFKKDLEAHRTSYRNLHLL